MYGDGEVCGCWVSQSIAGRTKKMYCARGIAAAGGKNGLLWVAREKRAESDKGHAKVGEILTSCVPLLE